MSFPSFDATLWLTGFVLDCTLLAVLLTNRWYRSSFWFVLWILFSCLETVVLFAAFRRNSPHLYFRLYWSAAFVDLILQLAVVLELARSVLTRNAEWVANTRLMLGAVLGSALLGATVIALNITPATNSVLDSVFARCNLFMTVLVCVVFSAIVVMSSRFGLSWPTAAERIGYGFTFWTMVSFGSDTLHSYWSSLPYFNGLEIIRTLSFQIVLGYWIVGLRKRRPSEQYSCNGRDGIAMPLHLASSE